MFISNSLYKAEHIVYLEGLFKSMDNSVDLAGFLAQAIDPHSIIFLVKRTDPRHGRRTTFHGLSISSWLISRCL